MPSALIVDDEPNIRRMVGALLASEGYEVRDAADGAAGITQARSGEPDVVPAPCEGDRGDEPRGARADHDDVHGGSPGSHPHRPGHSPPRCASSPVTLGARTCPESTWEAPGPWTRR